MHKLAFTVTLFGIALVSRAAFADGTPHSILYEGDYLFQGQRLVADDGFYHLEMQGDGNLVLYEGAGTGNARWWSGTYERCGSWPTHGCVKEAARYATLQSDGNFVVYFQQGDAGWSSNTSFGNDYGSAELWMQGDGNLVGYRWNGSSRFVSWATNTAGPVQGQSSPGSTITHIEDGTNFAGDDYAYVYTNDVMQCGQWCASSLWAPAASECNAFTWVPPGVQNVSGVCWLKKAIPAASYGAGLISGFIRH